MIDLALGIVQSIAVTAAFFAVPMLLASTFRSVRHWLGLEEYTQIPVLHKLSVAAGLVFSAVLLYDFGGRAAFSPGLFTPSLIFDKDGPWDLSFVEFLELRVLPFFTEIGTLWYTLSQATGSTTGILSLIAFILWGVACVICFLAWVPVQALYGALLCTLRVLLVAFTAFYVTVGAAWFVNNVGFLIFAIPLLLIRPPFYFTKSRGD